MTEVEPYTHLRAGADAPVPEGVYRVVGSGEGKVVLLCVADAAGRRAHTGVIERVDPARLDAAFEPASNPDAGFRPSDLLDPIRAFVAMIRYYLGV